MKLITYPKDYSLPSMQGAPLGPNNKDYGKQTENFVV